jgi:hypothetical protein
VRPGAAALIQKHHAPVNVIGGFKFANAPVIDLGTVPTASSEPTPLPASYLPSGFLPTLILAARSKIFEAS